MDNESILHTFPHTTTYAYTRVFFTLSAVNKVVTQVNVLY